MGRKYVSNIDITHNLSFVNKPYVTSDRCWNFSSFQRPSFSIIANLSTAATKSASRTNSGVIPNRITSGARKSPMTVSASSSYPSIYVADHLRTRALEAVLTEYATFPGRDIFAVYPQNRFKSTRLELFLDQLTAASGELPWEG